MLGIIRKRKWTFAIGLLLCFVLLPYLWSRLISTERQIVVVEIAAPPVDIAAFPIRVCCYNIAHGRGLADDNWDGGDAATRLKRLDDIAGLLKQIRADVVVLNEVDFDASWSNHVNQAEYLARKAGYKYRVEERNLDFRVLHRTWRFGNAILSRYPISNARAIDLPSYSTLETIVAGKKRGVACELDYGGSKLSVFGLHLSHRSEDIREQSAKAVVKLAELSPFPCILMGDMNSTPPGLPFSSTSATGGNAIQSFDESGLLWRHHPKTPVAEAEFTYRADQPKSIIDWIVISDALDFASYRAESSILSDHRPIVAEVRFAAENNGN